MCENNTNCVVVVNDRLEAPEFLELPESLELLRGSRGLLSCKASGKPMPKVTWYKDGRPIGLLQLFLSLVNKEDPITRLVASEIQLSNVSPQLNDGVYVVEAVNDAGRVSHEVQIVGKRL